MSASEDFRGERKGMAGVVVLIGAYIHIFTFVFAAESFATGNIEQDPVPLFFAVSGYVIMAFGGSLYEGGRREGETGIHYLGRVAVWPYAAGLRLCILAATAAPGVARECIDWLTTPRDDDEVGEE